MAGKPQNMLFYPPLRGDSSQQISNKLSNKEGQQWKICQWQKLSYWFCRLFSLFRHSLARACGVPQVGVRAVDCWQWHSGHYSHQSFLFSVFFTVTFSHRWSARIKKLILQKLAGVPKNLGVDTFPDPSAILGPPGGPFVFCRRWVSVPFATRLVFYDLSPRQLQDNWY